MSAESHGFKAEVQQLLDLMIHAVYSNRDVFLRELISNAADALDKARFLDLTEKELVPAASDTPGIRLAFDADARTLVIEDDGLGMTRDEAIENLGTIAHSGSKAFLGRLKEAGADAAPKLIGQFGVGFYSAFMVAERVEVVTRSLRPDAVGVRWVSEGAGQFTIEDHPRAHRGTTIRLTLREDAVEYADEHKLRGIVREHSNYLSWPIHLDGKQINAGRAIWAEPPSEVSDEEAREFYRLLSFDFEPPLTRVHLSVDSPLQYHALLFVPRSRPYDLFVPEADKGPRLYARRVLIAEHAKDLLPDWLRFVKGVVDSEDIPLNMSREMVQQTPVVRTIRDALVKRILKDLGKLADQPAEAPPADTEDAQAGAPAERPYDVFWRSFGILLKEGHYHDRARYGDRILPLLRFNTLHDADAKGLRSLAEIKASLPEGQDTLWYLTAPSREAALASPHLEAFRKKGFNVLLLTDVVDEWFIQGLEEAEGLPVKSVSRGALDLDPDDEADADNGEKEAGKAAVEQLAPWLQGLFGGELAGVRPSSRLTDSPAVLVDDDSGLSANMERILRAANQEVGKARRHLEINPQHPLIRNLARLHADGRDADAEPLARLLLDDALLLEGAVPDPAAVGRRLRELLVRASEAAIGRT